MSFDVSPVKKSEILNSLILLCTESGMSFIYEPVADKTYNKTCATSEDSDQPVHPHSLIRIFVDRMCLLQPKRDEREPLPY